MMKYTENALNILTVKSYKGVGKAWVVKYFSENLDVKTIISLLNNKSTHDESISMHDFELKKSQIADHLNSFGDSCDGVLAIGDHSFPRIRGSVKDSERPISLFYKGNMHLLASDNANVTVIGLLDPSEAIIEREKKIVAEIVKKNATIVSGLALGCDSVAHIEALNGGKTVAILPSPLNNILPAKNKDLAREIVDKGGLLVTEYFNDFKSKMELNSRYKERDRLQALFCDTIILAASYAFDSADRWNIRDRKLDSGARLAMAYAKEYKIPRAIMYDQQSDVTDPMFDLNRQLIKEDKEITILNQKSLEIILSRINSKESNDNKNIIYQKGLFDG